ncbi:MAG TPA: helix-turn-helix transcriptional regulator [Gammaproteobacteria bacterium]|nr:helix-turn-helix transcriptional regulator [Gammaproteobacteria bacterium]
MRQKQAFDTHSELLVQRYKQGIQLVKPRVNAESITQKRIVNLYQLPLSIYFSNAESLVVDGNRIAAEMVGESSIDKVRGKKPREYLGRHYEAQIVKNNDAIIRSPSMTVLDESGVRADDFLLQALSFKFPWYYENNVIGIMGCSIKIDAMSLHNFGHAFLALMSTGLLNTTQLPINIRHDIYFSRREEEVLAQLVRGKTAKQIGEKLNLSPRTIESYIENMKIKTNCQSKFELIDKFIDEV